LEEARVGVEGDAVVVAEVDLCEEVVVFLLLEVAFFVLEVVFFLLLDVVFLVLEVFFFVLELVFFFVLEVVFLFVLEVVFFLLEVVFFFVSAARCTNSREGSGPSSATILLLTWGVDSARACPLLCTWASFTASRCSAWDGGEEVGEGWELGRRGAGMGTIAALAICRAVTRHHTSSSMRRLDEKADEGGANRLGA
jgi:hypothetical protein